MLVQKLLKYLRGFEKECILGPLFKLLEASFELMIPLVVAKIVDVGIASGDRGVIFRQCLIMIALGFVGLLSAVTAQWFAAKAAVGFATRLRHGVMEQLLSLSYSQMDRLGSSTMITRLTSDINQVQNGLNLTIRLLLRSPFVVFGAMIMAFTIDVRSALIFVGVIPLLSLVVFGIMLITIPMYKKVQGALDGVTSATRENLNGVRVLRAFCQEKQQTDAFCQSTEGLTRQQISAGRISALLNPMTFVIINLAVVLLVKTGAIQVEMGILSQGMVIALYNYMSQILVELIKLANLIITMTKAAACATRVSAILRLQTDESTGTCREPISGHVEFRDVTGRYAGAAAPALEHISFCAEPGQMIGIIGGTGCGKTTLVNLIPGLYEAAEGQVLIDGRPVQDYDLSCLRSQIGVVPQQARLFLGTIRSNLLWGNEQASEEELLQALELAQAREIIEGKPEGLDAPVEQDGVNLSGGQRQRLTIARALVRKPRILILDDSASALDYATDSALRQAIRSLRNGPLTFLVSQRAASVRYADRILVLEDGHLAASGTHEQLLRESQVYQEIYYSQFPREVSSHA